MSRQNKANKNNYSQRGRLTPDEIARERMNQNRVTARVKEKDVIGKAPTSGEQEPNRPRSAPEE